MSSTVNNFSDYDIEHCSEDTVKTSPQSTGTLPDTEAGFGSNINGRSPYTPVYKLSKDWEGLPQIVIDFFIAIKRGDIFKKAQDPKYDIQNNFGVITLDGEKLSNFVFRVLWIEESRSGDVPTEQVVIEICTLFPESSHFDDSCLMECKQITLKGNPKKIKQHFVDQLGLDYTCFNEFMITRIFLFMLQRAKRRIVYQINHMGWQANNRYAFTNGVVDIKGFSQDSDVNYEVSRFLEDYSLQISTTEIISKEDEKNAAILVTEHLFCTTRSPISMCLYLYLVLSFFTTALIKLHRNDAPAFTPMLVAFTQTGKTQLCYTLLSFLKNIPKVTLSSGTTFTGLINKCNDVKDFIFLADDHKPDPTQGRRSEDIVDKIARMRGDNAAKSTALGSKDIDCMILITGEVVPPLCLSSISRMLIWNLTKEDISREEQNIVRANNQLYATHILSLLRWIESIGRDQLAERLYDLYNAIKGELLEKDNTFNERLASSYAWLIAVHTLMTLYFEGIGINIRPKEKILYDFAERELRSFQKAHLEDDPLYRFCLNLIDSESKFEIESHNNKDLSNCWGTRNIEYFFIFERKIDNLIDSSFGISKKDLLNRMCENNMLLPEKPKYAYLHRHKNQCVYKVNRSVVEMYIEKIKAQINTPDN